MDIEDILKNRPGYPGQIDGITCYLMGTWLEKFNHKQIIDAVLKPLGYAKSKGEKDRYQKRLSETDVLTCGIGVHAMFGACKLSASGGYRRGEKEVIVPLFYWGAFHWIEWMKLENMNPMMITTERHIFHGHRKYRLSAYETGNQLPGGLAKCSERTGYRGGCPTQ